MIIGKDFNKKCEQLLIAASLLSNMESDKSVSVEQINESLHFDRNEMRSYLEYLADNNFVELKSIGGPMLYGHISLTGKGLKKAAEAKKEK
jgi:Mn-dependent DtxR family transcriptional regulator